MTTNAGRPTTMTAHGRLKEMADASLDQIVAMAVAATQADLGVVALLDEHRRAWDVTVGAAGESRKTLSFCSYALLQPGPFCIGDLSADERFADDPIAALGHRSVIGVVITDAQGNKRGALCTFAKTPRKLDPAVGKTLGLLAAHASSLIGIRHGMTALREKHRQHLALLDTLQGVMRAAGRLAIVGTDIAGTVNSFSIGAERTFGHAAVEVVGRVAFCTLLSRTELTERGRSLSPDTEAMGPFETLLALRRARLEGGSGAFLSDEWLALKKGGTTLPVSLVVEPVTNEEGALSGYVAIFQDITERRIADELKSEFISTVSHELRTPLTSILGALGLLRGQIGGPLPPKAAELVDISHRNGERLLRLVNDILDLQKIESGHVKLALAPHDLRAIAARVVETDRPYAERLHVTLALLGDPGPIQVDVDAERIAQVLTNLISNATKFSPEGSQVDVVVEADGGRARVSVRDHGPGIPETLRPRLFGKFVQADGSERRQGGTGLGLSIVKAIVERHGGVVGFESTLGQGSTFTFELPR